MSVVALKKVTVFGLAGEKDQLLSHLQDLGILHPVRLAPKLNRPEEETVEYPRQTYQALRYLLATPIKRRSVTDPTGFDRTAVVSAAQANRRRRREVQDRIDQLRVRLRAVEPWGDFELPPLDELAGQRLWFYLMPRRRLRQIPEDLVWQVVQMDHRVARVVVVSKGLPAGVPGERSRVGTRSLSELRRALELAESELEDLDGERWSLTRWIGLIQTNLARAEDEASRRHTAAQSLDAGEIFAVQGWVPATEVARVEELLEAEGAAATFADPEPDEEPPTLLENWDRVSGGEDLVGFYQLPGYRDWDPSAVIFLSFALFFAMILADAGYAAVLSLLLIAFWRRLGKSIAGQRMRALSAAICVASLAYGALVGSYFGVTPAEGSWLGRLKLLDVSDFSTMMKLSIGVGTLHLILANALTAWHRWRSRKPKAALTPVGWITMMAGGLTTYLGGYGTAIGDLGLTLVAAGAGIVLLFTGRPVKGLKDLPWRLLDGLKELTGFSKAFGDILSYLRLFALGLASASLAQTFNQLAEQAQGSGAGIALLFGLLILILGHSLNLVLALIGGVVHGLRLNFIEMYNWSVYGEGQPFRAFRKKEKATWKQ
ncbi:MAG: V-type ATP synthase subunit I [Acidobacteriota bacterium]|nr:V-type ATP synthase subunit I [Acidobacteriota bacterium]